jgi:NDP-sugar pyrophosphorylase family protein
MIPINGRPFIHWQLEQIAQQGITSVVLCLGHKASAIIDFVGNGDKFGVEVDYSIEDFPLGTGGALKNAEKLLGKTFGVLYGDSYLPIDFSLVFESYKFVEKKVLMTIYKNNDDFDSSNVLFGTDKSLYYSKTKKLPEMRHIDYGFSVLSIETLQTIPLAVPCDLSDIFEDLSSNGKVGGLEVHERFYEIGSFNGIVELERFLRGEAK